jgi:hypothetical protein
VCVVFDVHASVQHMCVAQSSFLHVASLSKQEQTQLMKGRHNGFDIFLTTTAY